MLLFAVLCGLALAQGLSGTYTVTRDGVRYTLQLRVSGSAAQGTLSGSDGTTLRLEGRSVGAEFEGTLSSDSEALYVYGVLQGNQLTLTIAQLDASGQPDSSTAQSYVLTRQVTATTSPPPAAPQAATALSAFTGRFSGSGVVLELRGANGQFTGSILWSGKTYPVRAQVQGSRLIGQFTVVSSVMLFEAQVSGNTLSLTVSGKRYTLARVAASSASTTPPAPSAAAPPAARQGEWRDGAQYAALTRVTSRVHGVSFVVPQGFSAQGANGSALLGNGSGIGALVVPFVGASSADVLALVSKPLEVSADTVFQPDGSVQSQANRLSVRLTANTARGALVANAIALLGKGNGVVLYVFTDAAQAPSAERVASSLAAGVSLSASTVGATLDTARRALAGKYLNFFSYSSLPGGTYTGPTDRSSSRTWNLCSDGSYRYEGSAENRYTLLTPSGAGNLANTSGDANSGRWRLIVAGNDLTLLFFAGDGTVDAYTVKNLERSGGKLPYLNGRELSSFGASSVCR